MTKKYITEKCDKMHYILALTKQCHSPFNLIHHLGKDFVNSASKFQFFLNLVAK